MLERKPYTGMILARRVGLGLTIDKPRAAVLADCAGPAQPVPKVVPVEHEGYRRLVAALPCKHCGLVGYSQAAHPNMNKGAGTKTDDRLCFPLCCDRPGVVGCHVAFDQKALFTKEARRLVEAAWGADTRRQILAAGNWPTDLPLWSEE
ncbi:hypothetical protein A8M77_21100 [Variovorax sp. JS1663]|nr:hypothetical protein A8M77_21100 [Variovorax sp. JS1663]